MTTNTQLWLDPDSMMYKRVVIDTNQLPFRAISEGKFQDSPHITIVTNPVWNNGMFELTNYTLPYYPPSPVYIQPQPPQIIYVTNTVVVDSSASFEKLAEGAGTGLLLIAIGICIALTGWGLGKANFK